VGEGGQERTTSRGGQVGAASMGGAEAGAAATGSEAAEAASVVLLASKKLRVSIEGLLTQQCSAGSTEKWGQSIILSLGAPVVG